MSQLDRCLVYTDFTINNIKITIEINYKILFIKAISQILIIFIFNLFNNFKEFIIGKVYFRYYEFILTSINHEYNHMRLKIKSISSFNIY